MINIQAQMKELFGNSCYAYCIAALFRKTADIKILTKYVLEGWYNGYIEDDGYVAKPLQYIKLVSGETYKDVKKLSYKPKQDTFIVEWRNPKGGSHFTVENNSTISSDTALFDPSGNSISRANKEIISYREFIAKL